MEKQFQSLQDWASADLASSCINDRLISANVEVLQDRESLYKFADPDSDFWRENRWKWTNWSRKEQAQTLEKGCWIAFGTTIDGGSSPYPYAKPFHPRKTFDQGLKTVKYETTVGWIAAPILPWVDAETAQEIYQKHSVVPLEGETFWQCVRRCNLLIIITEGLKKALCLLSHGYPAIALRGVSCWHLKGTRELHEVLKEFTTSGRQIYICFDQDEKPRTIANVSREILKLGSDFQEHECEVLVIEWDSKEGKGIDDAVFGQGETGQEWIDKTVESSLTLTEFRQTGRVKQLLRTIKRLKTLSVSPERATEDGYLPKLQAVQMGTITVLGANLGSGKTVRIGADLVRPWIESGGNVLVLSLLNSLGQQTAKRFGIVHIHEHDINSSSGYSAFCSHISYCHGVTLCLDSLHRIPEWFLASSDRPLMVVLDEVNQGLDHLIYGGTLGKRQTEILDKFAEICLLAGQSGAIVIAEAEVYDHSLQLIKQLSGCDNIHYFHHRRHYQWSVQLGSGQLSGFFSQFLLDAVSNDGYDDQPRRLLWVTDSQQNAQIVEGRLRKEFPGKKIVRIDSETNREGAFVQFFDAPDPWLKNVQPDFLILSPSAKTGVSIEWEGFSAVYGYFCCLDTDTHLQLLGRYRPNVPRYVCVPPFINTIGDESFTNPIAVQRRLDLNQKALSAVYEVEAISATDDRSASIQVAALEYYSHSIALRGCQKAIARDSLRYELEREGHAIEQTNWGRSFVESAEIRAVREELWREDALRISKSGVCETIEAAYETLAKECSIEAEICAKKTIWRSQFPDISFDDAEQCYWVLTQQKGAMRRGVLLQASAENIAAAKELDRESAENTLTNSLGLSHRLPKNYVKALLLNKLGILQLANQEIEISNSDPRCIAIQKRALHFSKEIRYFLGLYVAEEYRDTKGRLRHTPIDICSKLLGKLNLELQPTRRVGPKNDRRRIHKIAIARVSSEQQSEAWENRHSALEAARKRLAEIHPLNLLTDEESNMSEKNTQDWQPQCSSVVDQNSETIATTTFNQRYSQTPSSVA